MVSLIIENCEEKLSEWLWLEYKHSAEIWGGAVFTNIKNEIMKKRLSEIGEVHKEPFYRLFKNVIILDPLAKEELRTDDFSNADAIVVGGILGYEVPKGRTKELISSKIKNAITRNLGKIQLSIDSAALVTALVSRGMKLKDIEITREVEIEHSENESTILPYGYVVVGGKVIVTPGLVEYLSR